MGRNVNYSNDNISSTIPNLGDSNRNIQLINIATNEVPIGKFRGQLDE